MDACSVFLYLGGGRGAYSTHKYIADLLGSATIDKKNDGMSKGNSGSTSINFDRQARELMTSEEVSRMPDGDCLIFITGQRPVYDRKYPTQGMKDFQKAKKLGDYAPDVQVKRTKEGEYLTLKGEGQIVELDEKSVEYYKMRKKEDRKIQIVEMSEAEFMEMNFDKNCFNILIK